MQTSNYGYLSRLDHLRFFAAILVVYLHFRGSISKIPYDTHTIKGFVYQWVNSGATGVSLFLVLSGFIFCVITNAGKKKIEYKQFLLNRVLRIFPLMIFVFFLALTVHGGIAGIEDIFRLLFIQFNTGLSGNAWLGHDPIIIPMWTLSVEFQFYMLFPFIALFIGRYGIKYAIGVILLMLSINIMLVGTYGVHVYDELYKSIVGRLGQFLIGIVTGYIYLKRINAKQSILSSASLFLASLVLMSFYVISEKSSFVIYNLSLTIEAILWALVAYTYLTMNIKINNHVDKYLSYLGSLSFSIYLIHLPVGRWITKMLSEYHSIQDPILFTTIFIVPAVLIASSVTFALIERPFINLRKGYTNNAAS